MTANLFVLVRNSSQLLFRNGFSTYVLLVVESGAGFEAPSVSVSAAEAVSMEEAAAAVAGTSVTVAFAPGVPGSPL